MMEFNLPDTGIIVQTIDADWLQCCHTSLDILRLDLLHPVISGNKWFKLKYYLEDAITSGAETVGTYGGAYSNHIVAVAYACRMKGIKAIGIIRGEEPAVLSDTMLDAKNYGMQLFFVNRASYRYAENIRSHFQQVYWIEEGGYGVQGAMGAAEILGLAANRPTYSHIVCAVGTGTMMAGIIRSVQEDQQVLGISVMKGNYELDEKINMLLDDENCGKQFEIFHDYHFGGYAKHPRELLDFMNGVWHNYRLPTDIVYTAKTFYAVKQLITTNTIPTGSNVLMIHSGGLQGNRSLPDNTLLF